MKKKLFFLPLLAALVLAGCSKEESDAGGGNGSNGEQYLAISIVSNTSGGSRADYTDGAGNKFEDGTETENAVEAVRLYFFSGSGDFVKIKKNASGNYYDIPKSDIKFEGSNPDKTVEQQIKAFIMIDAGEKLPAQVVAVVNPEKLGLDNNSINLGTLCDKVHDYASLAKESKFVMMNSVYAENQNRIVATTITPEHYKKNADDAKKSPVVIYVERNVGKVRVSTNMAEQGNPGDNLFKVYRKEKDADGKETGNDLDYTIGEGDNPTQVYVKFNSWDVTADLTYAYLSKHIEISWPKTHLGPNTTWNDPAHHRSYWAAVCNGGVGQGNMNQYFAYNADNHFKATKFDGSACTYCNENAERNGTYEYKPTVVIVKGTLCDNTGKPLTVTEYAGHRVIDDTNFTQLKNRYVVMMQSNTAKISAIPYKKVDEGGGETVYKPLEAADLTFVEAPQGSNPAQVENAAKAAELTGRYYVYACLTSAAEKYEWYSKSSEDDNGKATVKEEDKIADPKTEINAMLKELSHAKIWKTGQTYYYANIMHTPEKAGIVRNHIYDVKLTKVYGIGTPVYNEDLTIIPEKPQDEDTFVAAKIDILSWRLMTSDVVFDWD